MNNLHWMETILSSVRVSSHAGSWYTADRTELSSQLNTWLESCGKNVPNANSVRAIIVPNAVTVYCSHHETERSVLHSPHSCRLFIIRKTRILRNLLSSYMLDEKNLFVISSDFCHWGKRFRYQYYNKSDGAIWQSIEKLDHLGLNAIRSLKPKSFIKYLEEYRNTICGRRSIGVFLFMIDCIRQKQPFNLELKILNYTQSNRCQSMEDSSVSYTACALVSRE
ncbi:unnamed protein product [Schistosoma mattheei]|uniref:Protein MEMO1 n=1 Tax=Schistosoma mattheei TaxID=31246 RepID=A0AA85B635_9TREM|nr:unnamed protein product [Schistosoma mattheei]